MPPYLGFHPLLGSLEVAPSEVGSTQSMINEEGDGDESVQIGASQLPLTRQALDNLPRCRKHMILERFMAQLDDALPLSDIDPFLDTRQCGSLIKLICAGRKILTMITEYSLGVAEQLNLKEPPLRFGFTRVRWTTTSGYSAFDDYSVMSEIEVEGLLHRLRSRKHITCANAYSGGSSSWGANLRTMIGSVHNGFLVKQGQWLQNKKNSLLPTTQTKTGGSIQLASRPLYLLHCCRGTQNIPKLQHCDVQQMSTDGQLLRSLRVMYRRACRDSIFSLYALRGIHFVRFTVRKRLDLDPIHRDSLPPEPKWAEYVFEPRHPIDLMSAKYLRAMFYTIEDDESDIAILEQIPKVCERLDVCSDPVQNVGWGIEFEQSLNIALVLGVLFAFVFAGSVAFGVLYSYYGKDVGDAFTVSGLVAALTAIALQMWAFAEMFPLQTKT